METERGRSTSTKRSRAGSDPGGQVQKLPRLNKRLSRWDQQERSQAVSALSQGLLDARNEATGRKENQARQDSPFTEVKRRRKQRVIQKGSSTIEADGGVKAPFSVFLSVTSTNCTEETVKEKLILCASALGEQVQEGVALEILKVVHIPLNIPQGEVPRSRCWKVTVPCQFADHMVKNEAYPAAWGWRKWNWGPPNKESSVLGPKARNGRA